jgi:hypothetical protein
MTLRYETRSRVSTYTQSWVGGEPDFGVFESIATSVVGSGGVSSVTFSSIPTGYKHLQLRGMAQTNRGTYGIDELGIRFNGDTTSNYSAHMVLGDGASPSATSVNTTYGYYGYGSFGTTTGSSWGGAVMDILDYRDTNKFKTTRTLGGVDLNGTVGGLGGFVSLISSNWRSTAAITSINLFPLSGTTISQYSSFALYGIKG